MSICPSWWWSKRNSRRHGLRAGLCQRAADGYSRAILSKSAPDISVSCEAAVNANHQLCPIALVAHLPFRQLKARGLRIGTSRIVLRLTGQPEEDHAPGRRSTQVKGLPI